MLTINKQISSCLLKGNNVRSNSHCRRAKEEGFTRLYYASTWSLSRTVGLEVLLRLMPPLLEG